MWTGFIWLSRGTSGGLLSCKRQGISLLGWRLLVSQEEICSVKFLIFVLTFIHGGHKPDVVRVS